MRYADPTVCPDCRSALPHGAASCPQCELPVRHRLAVELFGTLTRADHLVAQLRALPAPNATGAPTIAPPPSLPPLPATPATPATSGAPATTTAPTTAPTTATTTPPPPPPPGPATPPAPGPITSSLPPFGAAPDPAPGGASPLGQTGVGFASVPKILLGLGALCILVAAVIFLAVSWSLLGVGGRTAVLVGITVGAGAFAVFLHRHELRIGAEAFAAIAVGMVALDVLGAESSGWLGDPSEGVLVLIVGLTLALVGTAFAALTRPHLGSPQVAAAVGAFTAHAGLLGATDHDLIAGHLSLATIALGGWLVLRGKLAIEAWGLLVVGLLAWIGTAITGLVMAASDPDLTNLWADGSGWSLLISAAALLLPGVVLRRRNLLVAPGAAAALIATIAITLPAVDASASTLALVALGATGVWTAGVLLLPRPLRPVAATPAFAGSVLLCGIVLLTAVVTFARWVRIGDPGTQPVDVLLRTPDPVTEPLVAAPAVAIVIALLAACFRGVAVVTWLRYGGLLAGVAGLVTLASYDVPLAAVAAGLLVLAAAATTLALLHPTDGHRTALGSSALMLAPLGALSGLPNAWLTTAGATTTLAIAGLLHLAGRAELLRVIGGVMLAPATVGTIWAAAAALDIDTRWTGVPALLAVGALAIARPRLEIEVPAILTGALASLVAVAAAGDTGGSLALHLTFAGFLLAASGLSHDSRRPLTGAGSALLLLATWVRLFDLGVSAPEPYTLPLALALVGFGLWHLQRNPQAGTAAALLPGLSLATVPSLLWVLHDPVSVRALVLGAACLALTVAGSLVRWSAPILVGAAVGAVLVLRELGPYAQGWPQWVWIGLAGGLLTIFGLTWERQLREARKAVGYLGRLR